MSQGYPTLSFLSSPETNVSGLVYSFSGAALIWILAGCGNPGESVLTARAATNGPSAQTPPLHRQEGDAPPGDAPSSTHATPLSPLPPTEPARLTVDGFNTAVYVRTPQHQKTPSPVVVVLHGNYDRPEWQCGIWREVADTVGWILCPRGIPTPWAHRSDDRWTYRGSGATGREIDAALAALARRHPGLTTEEGHILVGFSLGAILAPAILSARPGVFRVLFMIEGGADRLTAAQIRALKRSGIQGVGLAMSTRKNRLEGKRALARLQKAGLPAVFVDMTGAGHDYHHNFTREGRTALIGLLKAIDAN